MINLSHCYFNAEGTENAMPTKDDVTRGMCWLKIAGNKGSLIAKEEFERRKQLSFDARSFELIYNLMTKESMEKNSPFSQQHRAAIEEASKKGSTTAQHHLNIWKNLDLAMEGFTKNNSAVLIAALSKAIRLDHQIVNVPNLYFSLINTRFLTHPNELDTVVCYVKANLSKPEMSQIIEESYQKFPNDCFLIEMIIAKSIHFNMSKAVCVAQKALKPKLKSVNALYNYALVQCSKKTPTKKCIQALNDFIAEAPVDHRNLPAAYYRQCQFYINHNDQTNFKSSFEKGLAAEKSQLLCYLPYCFPGKDLMQRIYTLWKQKSLNVSGSLTGTYFTNQKLQQIMSNEFRKLLIKDHRTNFLIFEKAFNWEDSVGDTSRSSYIKPPSLVNLSPITLKKMQSTDSMTYKGFILEARIIEWAYFSTNIYTVIEDENGSIERLEIKNWPFNGNPFIPAMKTFRPGYWIALINPCMKVLGTDQRKLFIDTPACMKLDTGKAICSCCSKEADNLICEKCKFSKYCSNECLIVDINEFQHDKLCDVLHLYVNHLK